MTESDKTARDQHRETLVMVEGREAWARADAWARSVAGTPYGGTEPVRSTERSGGAPEPLDRRVMAKLLEKGSGR